MINRILAIRQKPTVLTTEYINNSSGGKGFHESLLQAFDVLEYIKDYLRSNERVDSRILLEIIEAMTFNPGIPVVEGRNEHDTGILV